MKIKKQDIDFSYQYIGSDYSEQDAIKNGHPQLTGKELQSIIVDKLVYGEYPMGYKFVAEIYADGKTEGINNVGSYDMGWWSIDMDKNTMSIKWENGWMDTNTRAYNVNGNIEFYDVATGYWRTTFTKFKNSNA